MQKGAPGASCGHGPRRLGDGFWAGCFTSLAEQIMIIIMIIRNYEKVRLIMPIT